MNDLNPYYYSMKFPGMFLSNEKKLLHRDFVSLCELLKMMNSLTFELSLLAECKNRFGVCALHV